MAWLDAGLLPADRAAASRASPGGERPTGRAGLLHGGQTVQVEAHPWKTPADRKVPDTGRAPPQAGSLEAEPVPQGPGRQARWAAHKLAPSTAAFAVSDAHW